MSITTPIHFYKYQAAGNDFIMLDGREADYSWLSTSQIAELCHRNLGIGADGIIILSGHDAYDFLMQYWNADGSVAAFCGNGGRATVAFATHLGIPKSGAEYSFLAGDGEHSGSLLTDNEVQISMKNVAEYEWKGQDFYVNTGVPHLVHWLQDHETDVKAIGAKLRFDSRFAPEGTNVTFIRDEGRVLHIDTYERGVEDITLACGTGVVAAVLASSVGQGLNFAGSYSQQVATGAGMRLQVKYDMTAQGFNNIRLIGPAHEVFNGTIYIRTS